MAIGDVLQIAEGDAGSLVRLWAPQSGGGGGQTGAKNSSGSVSLSNGAYVSVAFAGADDFDTAGYHDPASNNTRFTVPTGLGGLHRFTINATTTSGASTDRRIAYGINGGSEVILTRDYYANPGVSIYQTGSVDLNLSNGDYVEVRLFVDAGGGTGTAVASLMRC